MAESGGNGVASEVVSNPDMHGGGDCTAAVRPEADEASSGSTKDLSPESSEKTTSSNTLVPAPPPVPASATTQTPQTSLLQQSMEEGCGSGAASVVSDDLMEGGGDCSSLRQGADGPWRDSFMELCLEASELEASGPSIPEVSAIQIRSPDIMQLDIEDDDDIPEELRMTSEPEGRIIVGDLGDELGYVFSSDQGPSLPNFR